MRIGLTGASGILGRHLKVELESLAHEVVFYAGDVRDAPSVNEWVGTVERVVHAAALVPVDQVASNIGAAIAINSGGTANVADAVRRIGNGPLTYISTSHVYSSSSPHLFEEYPAQPLSLYGLTKLQGEEWVKRLAKEHLIVRVFSFFDVLQKAPYLVPSLRERISTAPVDTELELEGAGSTRDIADAKWMAQVAAQLIQGRRTGIVNCGTGVGHSVLQIACMLARAMNRPDIRWSCGSATASHMVSDASKLRNYLPNLPAFDLNDALIQYARQCEQENAQ